MQTAKRMNNLKTDIFTEMGKIVEEVRDKWEQIIDLGIGSPDRSPAEHVIKCLLDGVANPANYRYTSIRGLPELREAVANWYQRRFGVELNPETEIISLMGSQEGLALLPQVFLDPGDIALIPDPCYPIYRIATELAGGVVYPLPLTAENDFLPDFSRVDLQIADRAKLMILNYPNNPIACTAPPEFFEEVVNFARKHNIVVCHDAAYTELAFDGYRPSSFLEIPGAKEVGIEFHSLSKTYNFAGCRLAFAVGNPELIEALARLRSNTNYGVFTPIQLAGAAALNGPQDVVNENVLSYQRRRDILVDGLRALGWKIAKPKATMFVWAPIPDNYENSTDFAVDLIRRAGVVVIPGSAFGNLGDRYVRFGIVAPEEQLLEAIERIKNLHLFS
ncbi:MAG TPA: aminotransferase class I/II-fold pyridoxal phosphate-dependent enzyme [Clostridia bacterium]|jgi:LL-diaminopimelate aminotransferase|nr:aminotransferase class I/II-fold pyridoxal phosphate-dependent enzyme [Clostridia bacterium]